MHPRPQGRFCQIKVPSDRADAFAFVEYQPDGLRFKVVVEPATRSSPLGSFCHRCGHRIRLSESVHETGSNAGRDVPPNRGINELHGCVVRVSVAEAVGNVPTAQGNPRSRMRPGAIVSGPTLSRGQQLRENVERSRPRASSAEGVMRETSCRISYADPRLCCGERSCPATGVGASAAAPERIVPDRLRRAGPDPSEQHKGVVASVEPRLPADGRDAGDRTARTAPHRP